MINVGIVGFGYWGPNLARNFSAQKNARLYAIAESRGERQQLIKSYYPDILIYKNAYELINDTKVDAVIIATPVFTHFDFASKALLNGKHVLIEKPMTANAADASELILISERKGLTLMVDHTFLYTGAVKKMKELVETDIIGSIQYFDSTRINLGLFQPDVNVLWDLAPHDISILNHLVQERPYSINATGISHLKNGIENVAYLTVNYNSNIMAHFNCSWTSPVKVRQTLVGGDKKMILYNDIEPSEKIRIYDTSYSVKSEEEQHQVLIDYRQGDVIIPKLSNHEALNYVAKDFLNSIINNVAPLSHGIQGYEVVKILEAAQKSIINNGKEIKL